MPLAAIRKLFVETTGRYDLDEPEGVIGSAFFINAGQKMLDRMLSDGKALAVYFKDLAAGNVLLTLPKCRVIDEVFIIDSTSRVKLEKKQIHDLRGDYADETTSLDYSKPAYWSPCVIRPYPKVVYPANYAQQWAFDNIVSSGHENYNGILFMPPSDAVYTMEVWGMFYSDPLVKEEDKSYWTEEHPETLIIAAMYQLERFYRNTEGQRDLMETLKSDMNEFIKDVVEQENINEMSEV